MGAWEITRKDLWLQIRDRRAIAILLLFPLIFIAMLGFSTGQLLGWQQENQILQIVAVQESDSALADRLLDVLNEQRGLEVTIVDSRELALQKVEVSEANAALFVGADFPKRVQELNPGDLLYTEKGKLSAGLPALDMELKGRKAFGGINSIISELVFAKAVSLLARIVAKRNPLMQQVPEPTDNPNGAVPQTASDISTEGPTKSQAVYQEIVPSYTVMFVFFLVNIMARSFIGERELGTLRRLQLAPITPTQVLIGKTLPFVLLSLIQTLLLFLCGKVMFGMDWGPEPLMLLPVILCTSLAATGLGLLIATMVKTDSQVSAYANFIVILMAGISGCFMPRDWLPMLMQKISLVTPHSWALMGYHQLLSTSDPQAFIVWKCCGMLLLFAGLFFLGGCWQFGLRQED